MSQLLEDVKDLIAELEGIAESLDFLDTEAALDELECQEGTINTMLIKAGRR